MGVGVVPFSLLLRGSVSSETVKFELSCQLVLTIYCGFEIDRDEHTCRRYNLLKKKKKM